MNCLLIGIGCAFIGATVGFFTASLMTMGKVTSLYEEIEELHRRYGLDH